MGDVVGVDHRRHFTAYTGVQLQVKGQHMVHVTACVTCP